MGTGTGRDVSFVSAETGTVGSDVEVVGEKGPGGDVEFEVELGIEWVSEIVGVTVDTPNNPGRTCVIPPGPLTLACGIA